MFNSLKKSLVSLSVLATLASCSSNVPNVSDYNLQNNKEDNKSFSISALSGKAVSFVSEQPSDYTSFKLGTSFTSTWTFKNKSSKEIFIKEARLVSYEGQRISRGNFYPINLKLKANQSYTLSVPMYAPNSSGQSKESFQLLDENNNTIKIDNSTTFWRIIKAVAPEASVLNAPIVSQNDSRWKYTKLGTSSLTIGGYGCAITSASSAFQYFGVNMNPADVNTALNKTSGGYVSGNMLNWGRLENASGFKLATNTISSSQVDSELKSGNPIIARVIGYFKEYPTHFVLIVGKNSSGEFIINEPFYGNREVLRKGYIDAYHVIKRK